MKIDPIFFERFEDTVSNNAFISLMDMLRTNYGELAIIRSQAGFKNHKISVKKWVDKTNAVGMRASAGRDVDQPQIQDLPH